VRLTQHDVFVWQHKHAGHTVAYLAANIASAARHPICYLQTPNAVEPEQLSHGKAVKRTQIHSTALRTANLRFSALIGDEYSTAWKTSNRARNALKRQLDSVLPRIKQKYS
jgi:hypothetical protein